MRDQLGFSDLVRFLPPPAASLELGSAVLEVIRSLMCDVGQESKVRTPDAAWRMHSTPGGGGIRHSMTAL